MTTIPTLAAELELGALVIGMDEVGRGALAGPVAVGAVAIAPLDAVPIEGVRDSKLLSEARREALYGPVSGWGVARAVGLATAAEVDRLGIMAALGIAGARALAAIADAGIELRAAAVLLDGIADWLTPALEAPPPVVVRAKADRDCASVATASVLAKVHRDRLMVAAAREHPGYGWESNKGYGSAAHLAAIAALGPSPMHRLSWLPVD